MPTIVSMGVHILDVLGRHVSEIPPGQNIALIDEIRITAAGTAAGRCRPVHRRDRRAEKHLTGHGEGADERDLPQGRRHRAPATPLALRR